MLPISTLMQPHKYNKNQHKNRALALVYFTKNEKVKKKEIVQALRLRAVFRLFYYEPLYI